MRPIPFPPRYIEPMLLTLVEKPPEGDGWVHEIKYDGYRTQLAVDGADSRAFTRNGHDWSRRYRPLLAEATTLRCKTAIIDGEVIVQNERGISYFKALPNAIRLQPERLILYAFDLLMLDGRDLCMEPLADRRKRLEDLVQGHPENRIHFSADLVGNGPSMFRAADAMGLEGIVSKRPESRYISGRTKAWLKVKTFTESVYDVVGVEESRDGATMALLATRGTEPKLVGTAFVTLGGKERETFWSKVKKLGTPQSRLRAHQKRKALWLAQGLTARVRHLRGEETLRHATVRAVVDPDTPVTPARKPEAR